MAIKQVKVNDKSVAYCPYVPAKGMVMLAYEESYFIDEGGFEEPHKKESAKRAVVVAVGPNDSFGMDDRLTEGQVVLMPLTNKQRFKFDGHDFYLVHHMDIKLYDPIVNKDMMRALLKEHISRLPKDIQEELANGQICI